MPQDGTEHQQGNEQQRGTEGDGELLARIQRLIQREGGTNEAITTLLGENARYRDRIRSLEGELNAERKKVPEGAVILQGEEAQAWEAYKSFGKPDEVKERLTERDELANRLSQTERAVRLREAAEVLRWDVETLDTLARTPDGQPFDFQVVEEEVEGEDGEKRKAKIPYIVTGEGDAEEKVRLEEHARNAWHKFLPVLAPDDQQPPAGRPQNGSPRLPRQQGDTGTSKGPKAPPEELLQPTETRLRGIGMARVNTDASLERTRPPFVAEPMHPNTMIIGGARVAVEDFEPDERGRRFIPAGTLVGRTFAERDAGVGFGPAATGAEGADEEFYLTAFDVTDANNLADVELLRHGTLIYEDRLPADTQAAIDTVRGAYQCIISVDAQG